jgi:hypothetical protein
MGKFQKGRACSLARLAQKDAATPSTDKITGNRQLADPPHAWSRQPCLLQAVEKIQSCFCSLLLYCSTPLLRYYCHVCLRAALRYTQCMVDCNSP